MKIEIDLQDWVADALTRGPSPAHDCGPSLEDRLGCIAEHWARTVLGWEDDEKRKALYRAFGVRLDDDKDDPFGL